jgi:hypothetical protein
MNKPHAATPHSAAALARLELGATGVIVVRMKEQPIDLGFGVYELRIGHRKTTTNMFTEREFKNDAMVSERQVLIPVGEWMLSRCPWQVGNIIPVKEKSRPVFSGAEQVDVEYFADNPVAGSWKPAQMLSAKFVRTHLRVTAVACKRLQDVTEDECRLYGIESTKFATQPLDLREQRLSAAKLAFSYLWESIHGPAAWSANEFHWFITGEKCNP